MRAPDRFDDFGIWGNLRRVELSLEPEETGRVVAKPGVSLRLIGESMLEHRARVWSVLAGEDSKAAFGDERARHRGVPLPRGYRADADRRDVRRIGKEWMAKALMSLDVETLEHSENRHERGDGADTLRL